MKSMDMNGNARGGEGTGEDAVETKYMADESGGGKRCCKFILIFNFAFCFQERWSSTKRKVELRFASFTRGSSFCSALPVRFLA